MKKIFLLLSFAFCYFLSFSQSIVNRSNQTVTVSDARLQAGLNLFIPRYQDTTSANNQIGIDSLGAIIFTYDVMGYWGRIWTGSVKKWERVGSGSSINIYNSDGILTGNRLLTGNNGLYTLSFDSLLYLSGNTYGNNISWVSRNLSNPDNIASFVNISPSEVNIGNQDIGATAQIFVTKDSIRFNYLNTPSISTLGSYKLQARSPTGGFVDYTGSIGGNSGISAIYSKAPLLSANDSTVQMKKQPHLSWNPDNILDKSGLDKHLTMGGASPVVPTANDFGTGIWGLVFDQFDMLVTEGYKYALPTLGDWSFEVRIKRNTTYNGTEQAIFGVWKDTATASKNSYLCYFGTDNKLRFIGQNDTLVSTSTITDANAHAIAIVNSSGTTTMYIDGVREDFATMTYGAAQPQIAFVIGDKCDYLNSTGGAPFVGHIGDFRMSVVARYSGASYSVPTTALTIDTATVALLDCSALHGTYFQAAAFQGNIITRAANPIGDGGWGNGEGFFRTNDNKFGICISGYNLATLEWLDYVFTSPTMTGSPWTINSKPTQTPAPIEGDLSGNGTLWPWKGKYFHWYHSSGPASLGILVSTSQNMYDTFPTGVTVLNPGNFGWGNFYDPTVRPSPDGTFLEMYLIGQSGTASIPLGGARGILYSTSTDGYTWSTPVLLTAARPPGFTVAAGEPEVIQIGNFWIMGIDGGKSGSARNAMRFGSRDRKLWFPLGRRFGGSGGLYIGCSDQGFHLDTANNRLITLVTNSESINPTQPTNSDEGMWYEDIVGLDTLFSPIDPIYGSLVNTGIALGGPGANEVYSSNYFKHDTVTHTTFYAPDSVATSATTAMPKINFGSFYSPTPYLYPKIILYQMGGGNIYGIGVSGSKVNFINPSGVDWSFWQGSTERMNVGSTTLTFNGNLTLPSNGTTPPTLSLGGGGFGSGGITFFNSTFGIQQQSSELRMLIPSGSKLGISQGGTERFSFLSSGIARIGTTGGGQIDLYGSSSGIVSILPGAAAAGTYNFRFPTSAGTAGQPLLSGGGGASAQTYGTLGVGAGGTGATGTPSNGQLLIGNGSTYSVANVTSSGGTITITNGSGTINMDIPSTVLSSNSWTSTPTGLTNIDAVSTNTGRYTRINDRVHGSFQIIIDPTATGLTEIELTLPVASDFAQVYQATGVANCLGIAGQQGVIEARVSENTLKLSFIATNTSSQTWDIQVDYDIISL